MINLLALKALSDILSQLVASFFVLYIVSKVSMKVEGIKSFTLEELEKATNNFEITSQIGQGGYGKVYRGVLGSGLVVAIKRARHGSLQGEKEFFTEIELLSRLHHRNLVSLVGYCDEESEQVYTVNS